MIWLDKNFCLLDNKSIRKYWEKNKIDSIQDIEKIVFTNDRIEKNCSPYRNYARMLISQNSHITNGMFLDGAHMCYLEYVDLIISDDRNFRILKNSMTFNEYLTKINLTNNEK